MDRRLSRLEKYHSTLKDIESGLRLHYPRSSNVSADEMKAWLKGTFTCDSPRVETQGSVHCGGCGKDFSVAIQSGTLKRDRAAPEVADAISIWAHRLKPSTKASRPEFEPGWVDLGTSLPSATASSNVSERHAALLLRVKAGLETLFDSYGLCCRSTALSEVLQSDLRCNHLLDKDGSTMVLSDEDEDLDLLAWEASAAEAELATFADHKASSG